MRPSVARAFAVSGSTRRGYDLDDGLFDVEGPLATGHPTTARAAADAVNTVRPIAGAPDTAISAGDLMAASIISEATRLVVRRRLGHDIAAGPVVRHVRSAVGTGSVSDLLDRFVAHYPPTSVFRGTVDPAGHLDGTTEGLGNDGIALRELLMLRLANENPAFERFGDLRDDGPIATAPMHGAVLQSIEEFLDAEDDGGGGIALSQVIRAPFRANPTSLSGQLEYVRVHWAAMLGGAFDALLERIVRVLDILEEERRPRGGGPAGDPGRFDMTWSPVEEERFSEDRSWMPRVVLMAKSTHVWLDQLSRRHERPIHRLDEIPDDELDALRDAGITGLWLIGLWERSPASRRIKHLRGDTSAVASAYAVHDYEIAADLGGHTAYETLRERAAARGVRLAGDMVPNHVGIDARWVVDHPDWFVSIPEPPYPAYRFTGPDLSTDERVGIQIEDHYWDGTDAAVVFRRFDRATGASQYVYHGNDGTAIPWNDTAQLDYLNPEAREAVIRTIVHVARLFPIIRFDAAMTLARKHVQRLWYPPPGEGGAIPSRAERGLDAEAFNAAMPQEFWREVVDRVAVEAPDTLLLAEAFWLMEGYFVRTLGMHRVYNSAFMHMTRDERNAEYRQLVANVLRFDPEVLQRFVNFMNNPDEASAAVQYGSGDKYMGVATLMVTMPGLPMFGHGQLEGLHEKYGQEFKHARWDEAVDESLVERHRNELYPLLHRRAQFAGASDFLFFDFVTSGGVDENVFAYANDGPGGRSLVLYNNAYTETEGTVHTSVPSMDRSAGRRLRQRTLAEGWKLEGGDDAVVQLRDHLSGLEFLHRSDDVAERGFRANLHAYQRVVLVDIEEHHDADLARLCDELAGRGVPSVAEAMVEAKTRPVVDALHDMTVADGEPDPAALEVALARIGVTEAAETAQAVAEKLGWIRPAMDVLATTEEPVFDRYVPVARLLRAIAGPVAPLDDDEAAVASICDRFSDDIVRWSRTRGSVGGLRRLLGRLVTDDEVADLLAIHRHRGDLWFDRDGYRRLARGIVEVAMVGSRGRATATRAGQLASALGRLEERSGYRVERLLATLS